MGASEGGADDRELMARLARGDREALTPLVERHYRRLYRIALGYLRQREDALDVVQEAFVKVFQAAARWDGSADAGPWLSRVTVNLSIDRWRRNKRRGQTFSPLVEGDHLEVLADHRPAPDRGVQGRESGERLAARAQRAARAPARGGGAAPLPGAEPRGDRDDARHEPRDREEQPAPRAAPDARDAHGGGAVILAHLRLRRRVSLLAAGLLEGREREQALAHLAACARCRADHEALAAWSRRSQRDPLRDGRAARSGLACWPRACCARSTQAEAPARRPRAS